MLRSAGWVLQRALHALYVHSISQLPSRVAADTDTELRALPCCLHSQRAFPQDCPLPLPFTPGETLGHQSFAVFAVALGRPGLTLVSGKRNAGVAKQTSSSCCLVFITRAPYGQPCVVLHSLATRGCSVHIRGHDFVKSLVTLDAWLEKEFQTVPSACLWTQGFEGVSW